MRQHIVCHIGFPKSMDESMKEPSTPPISEESWLSHFRSLHSDAPLNSHQEAIIAMS